MEVYKGWRVDRLFIDWTLESIAQRRFWWRTDGLLECGFQEQAVWQDISQELPKHWFCLTSVGGLVCVHNCQTSGEIPWIQLPWHQHCQTSGEIQWIQPPWHQQPMNARISYKFYESVFVVWDEHSCSDKDFLMAAYYILGAPSWPVPFWSRGGACLCVWSAVARQVAVVWSAVARVPDK